jgi:hypothetical protein
MSITGLFGRRSVLKAGALLGGLSALLSRAALADAQERNDSSAREGVVDQVRMTDIPLNSTAKVTVERRGQIVLIGINRPYIHNRVDPEPTPASPRRITNMIMTLRCGLPSCLGTVTIFPEASTSMRLRRS